MPEPQSVPPSALSEANPRVIVGFDPGRDKCGLAVMGVDGTLYSHQVVAADAVATALPALAHRYRIAVVVIGNQTTARQWQHQLAEILSPQIPIQPVDERYSTLEARDRYWQMYPPQGLARWVPQSFRSIDRPLDDIAALILIERYLATAQSTP